MQGTILASRYRVIKYIAEGGFGKTYLAEDIQIPGQDWCVVKQLYPNVDDSGVFKIARRLFKTEAETLNTLGFHDRIPGLLAYFEEDEKFYLVQQYIEGHTLTQELVIGTSWSEVEVIELLHDCLGILDFIHQKGVIHRDVKPDNLIRRQSDRKLVLVDFGTVKAIVAEQTQLVSSTVVVGTKGYMPTEQARGRPGTTSDIYALGIIAIQALIGIHPIDFAEDDRGEIVWQNLAQCSRQLKQIIAKMTRFYFKERYQSASEIIQELNQLTNSVHLQTSAAQYTSTNRQTKHSAVSHQFSDLDTPQVTGLLTESSKFEAIDSTPQKSIASPGRANRVNSPHSRLKSRKTIVTLGVALTSGAIASGGIYFIDRQGKEKARANLAQQVNALNSMIEQQDYQGCYEKAIELKTLSAEASKMTMPQEQQQEFEANCGLSRAKQEAEDLKLVEAIAIAKTLPKNTSFNEEIQQQTESWSAQLLQQATKIYEQSGDLQEAFDLVKQIPQDSPVRPQVIDAKDRWKAETEENLKIINAATQALEKEQWQDAKQQAAQVQDSATMYWQQQAQEIIDQAAEGIAASSVPQQKPKAIAPATPAKAPVVKPQPKTTAPPKVNPPKPKPPVVPPSVPPEQLRDLGDRPDQSNQSEQPLRDL